MGKSGKRGTVNCKKLMDGPAVVAFPLWILCAFAILTITKLWLVSGQSITAIGFAGHDDRLFLNLASELLHGRWLGPYNNLTLAKGPFYPLWIATAFILGVPLLLSQHLLYITACTILVIALRPLLPRPAILLLVYAILLFNPISYTDGVMTRVIREGIYPALTILLVAGAIGLLARHDHPLKILLAWSIGIGFALSALWLTREEGIWIVPAILFVVGFTAIKIWQKKMFDLRRLAILCVLPVAIWIVTMGIVAGINKACYGVFTTVDSRSHDFLAAYGSLSRVKHAHWQPYILVPKETRERIYHVSPAFAELRPYLEGESGKKWSSASCKALSICDDIGGGWFMWALRDAVAAAGHYTSGASAANYYRRMAAEINAACAKNSLDCGAMRASLMPPWHGEYAWPLVKAIVRAAVFLVRFEGFSAHPSLSTGWEDSLILFRDLTGGRLSPTSPPNQIQFNGWAVAVRADSVINVSVRNADGSLADASIRLDASPDVYSYFLAHGKVLPHVRESRFDIITSCTERCYLYLKARDRLMARIPIDGSIRSLQTPDLYFQLDYFGPRKNTLVPMQSKLNDVKIEILNRVGSAYQIVIPILIAFGLLAYASSTVHIFRRGIDSGLWVVNTSLLIAIFMRVLIFSMVHVTSFLGINTMYLSPAYPLLLTFVVLAMSDCWNSIFKPGVGYYVQQKRHIKKRKAKNLKGKKLHRR